MQTLCAQCNREKGINQINFRIHAITQGVVKKEIIPYSKSPSDDPSNAIARIVNNFYHCAAMCNLNYHERKSGQYYYVWEIVLYPGNDSKCLELHSAELLEYIHDPHKGLEKPYVKEIIIKN